MTKPGIRVWVVRNVDDTTVYTYGFGTYIGNELMPGWNSPDMLATCENAVRKADTEPEVIDYRRYYEQRCAAGSMTRAQADASIAETEARIAADRARPVADRALELARGCGMNPRIRLDTGELLWGAECWWKPGDDDTPIRFAKGRRIIQVTPPGPPAEADPDTDGGTDR